MGCHCLLHLSYKAANEAAGRRWADMGGSLGSSCLAGTQLLSPAFSDVPLWEAREANGEETQDLET